MRLEDVSPRTWLLGTVAGWALVAWMLALAGMGGRLTPLPDDPSLLQSLPKPGKAPPERLGPFAQYAEIATRPLFSQDRRPQPFSLGGDEDTSNDFDYILSGVLLVPQVKLAMIQPSDGDGGESLRVKLGDSVEAAPAWRLIALNPRSAVFEGPGGQKTLELRIFDGTGGEPPSPTADAQATDPMTTLQPAAAAVPRAANAGIPGGQGAQKPDATGAAPPPQNTEQQMDALRKRIEQRRAQLRAQQARQTADPAGATDNP